MVGVVAGVGGPEARVEGQELFVRSSSAKIGECRNGEGVLCCLSEGDGMALGPVVLLSRWGD